jgi:hypothetical protein
MSAPSETRINRGRADRTKQAEVFDETNLVFVEFQGNDITEEFYSEIESFDAAIHLTSPAMAITKTSNEFRTKLSGYIGIAPYFSMPESEWEDNFMYSLKQNGYIDHMITTFIASSVPHQSIIKFGQYETEAIEGDFTYLKTVDDSSWTLQSTKAVMGQLPIYNMAAPSTKKLVIDPQLPYLYVPIHDFTRISIALVLSFNARSLRCTDEYFGNRCIFNTKCEDVPDVGADINLTMVDQSEGHVETGWVIKQKDLLIDGSVFGDTEDSCHFAIMRSE